MSIDRSKAAALFVDLQEEHRQDPRYLVAGFEGILAKAQRLQQAARACKAPVLHSAYVVDSANALRPFHPKMANGASAFSEKGSPLTDICAEVGPVGDETVLVKTAASAFDKGALEQRLREGGVEWLFVAGVWTEACIDATVRDGVDLGFRIILIKDVCGSGTAAMHQTGILNLANRLYGGAVVDTDQAVRLLAGETVDAWQVQGSARPFALPTRTRPISIGKFDQSMCGILHKLRGRRNIFRLKPALSSLGGIEQRCRAARTIGRDQCSS